MIYVLDTNVLSEMNRESPDPSVSEFFRRLPVENLRVSSIVLAEISQGVENNPTSDLKQFLADCLALPQAEFGEAEALAWGKLTSAALKNGASLDLRDTFIAAIAVARGWTVATRNVKDFSMLEVNVFNPWEESL